MNLYLCPACQTPNEKLETENPPKRCDYCGFEREEYFEIFATDQVIRIDLLADRPDLFDPGGLARALKGYLEIETGLPRLNVKDGEVEVFVDKELAEDYAYRPYIVCAVVKIPALDHTTLREIMRLQENLHWGIGRGRKLASIGVYDFDTIKPPIRYTTVDPKNFSFHPLGMPETLMTPEEILLHHPKGIDYANLLAAHKKYPILIDENNLVLSMPPIINSDETKCKIGTSRLFIDVTGIVKQAPMDALKTLVSALVEIGGEVESVKINYPDHSITTPDLTPGCITINYEDSKKWLGIDYTPQEMIRYIEKMRMSCVQEENSFKVCYPPYRSDIRHAVDVYEDIAIGYGYQNIQPKLVPNITIGYARPEEELSQLVRNVMIGLGFTEILSLHLYSIERLFTRLGMEPGDTHAIVSNPKTIEQKVLRCHLMAGIMEFFNKNRRKAVPQKIFEIGNVILLDNSKETFTSEYKHVSFAILGPETGYAEIRMYLDALLHELGFKAKYQPYSHPTFCEGRCALITNESGLWGIAGEIHPQILNNYSLAYPVSLCELRLINVI
jgi:phenylalanyl-tRNA synthetase beta chain